MFENMLVYLIGSIPMLVLVAFGLYLLSTKIDRLKCSIEYYVDRIEKRIDELHRQKE